MKYLITILFFLSSSVYSQTLSEIAQSVKNTLSAQTGFNKNIGTMIGIYYKGETKFISLGEVKRGSGVVPDKETLFEIGSITKTFTGLLLAHEIETGFLNGDETLDYFRPEWRGQKTSQISLRQLMTHRSGLPASPCNFPDTTDYNEQDLVNSLTNNSLARYPNCKIEIYPSGQILYSNWAVSTLGYVMAYNHRTTYAELLEDKILSPLGLKNTAIFLSPDQKKRAAQGYDEKYKETPLLERKILHGQGALKSNVNDLILYAKAYLKPESTPLNKSLKRAMKLQYQGPKDKIAYGFFITPEGAYSHRGETQGYRSELRIYPAKDLAVVYLTNTAKFFNCFAESIEFRSCFLN